MIFSRNPDTVGYGTFEKILTPNGLTTASNVDNNTQNVFQLNYSFQIN